MTVADRLFEKIAHGDEEHQQWLKDTLVAFFAGELVDPNERTTPTPKVHWRPEDFRLDDEDTKPGTPDEAVVDIAASFSRTIATLQGQNALDRTALELSEVCLSETEIERDVAQFERRLALAAKDTAYTERNQVLALLARMAVKLGWRAGVQHQPAAEPEWRTLLFVDLPTGQASWHYHDSERHLLAGLPDYAEPWDGHTTDAKYARVRTALATP